jgi:hypothetical protein
VSHIEEHFFKGACICPCKQCTVTLGGETRCICPDCPKALCGIKLEGKIKNVT